MRPLTAFALSLLTALLLGCGSAAPAAPGGGAPSPTSGVATATPAAELTATPAATPTPARVRQDIRATRLVIPRLGIDEPVQDSFTVPYRYTPPPGCPPRPQDTETVTVPESGIATPVENLEGLENVAWIYGHSRWLGRAGVFFRLPELNIGDELFVDGVDRQTGQRIERKRFIVEGFYLTDVDSGGELINAEGPDEIPTKPTLVLQTSVREDGLGKQWILSRETLLAKAENLVAGSLDDHCKYLLLFVVASAS